MLQNLADRKAALEEAERQTNAMDADNDADDGFEEGSEPEESLQTAYESYTDTAGFEALGIDDSAVISKALHFQPEQLHCLLTYLNSAAMLTKDSEIVRNTEDGTTVYVGQAIRAADAAFAYAFHSPLLDSEYLSTEIMAVFDEAQNVLPDISASLFAASAMHALFHTPSVPDYSIEDFSFVVENFGLDTYPAMLPLLGDLVSFREKPDTAWTRLLPIRPTAVSLNRSLMRRRSAVMRRICGMMCMRTTDKSAVHGSCCSPARK